MDNVSQLGSEIILGARGFLGNRRADTNWRSRNELPDEHFRSTFGRIHTQKLAVAWRDHLEEVQDSEWIQIIICLLHMLFEICVILLRLIEGFLESDETCRSYLLGSSRFEVGLIFVMRQLEYSNFSNLTVDRFTVRADFGFAALFVDPLANLGPLQIIDSRFS